MLFVFLRLRLASVIKLENRLFFRVNNLLTGSLESVGILLHNLFKLLSVSGTFSVEVTNTPETHKVLALKLTGRVFFFKQKIVRFKKWSTYNCLLMFCRLICDIVDFF